MTKAKSLAVAAALMDSIADSIVIAKPAKAVKAKVAKVAKAKVAKVATVAEVEAVAEMKLTAKELAVLKAVAASDFADPASGAVPTVVIAFEVEKEIPRLSLPGVVANLNKKGLVSTSKSKGLTLVLLSALGLDFAKAAA